MRTKLPTTPDEWESLIASAPGEDWRPSEQPMINAIVVKNGGFAAVHAALHTRKDRETPAMKLGYTIIYVPDVSASLTFFEQAFGLKRKFLHESGAYGELDTGETTLSFAAHELGDMNFPGGHVHADQSSLPLGFEIALVTDNVQAAHAKAIKAGATEMALPQVKPWGQTVSYVRSPDGVLVELCTPVSGAD